VIQTSLFSIGLHEDETTEHSVDSVLQQPFDSAVMTVIDLETTGLSAKKNSITEVTAIQYVNGEEIAKFSTLVQPNDAITPEVEHLTGITAEMVSGAPPLMMVMNDLLKFMGQNPIIVGHNVTFDLGFLKAKCDECGFFGMETRIAVETSLCTRVLATKILPGLPSYEGIVVATQCGYYNPNPHRAEADVRMAAAILFELVKKGRANGQAFETVGDLLRFQGQLQLRG
jgi:DNA polymerase III epsilon subunit family exonuclease